MLLKEQKGVSIWRKEKPFLRQASSTEGVERTITTGVISSNSICPSGVLAGSIVFFFFLSFFYSVIIRSSTILLWWCGRIHLTLCLSLRCCLLPDWISAVKGRLRFGNHSPERGREPVHFAFQRRRPPGSRVRVEGPNTD